MAARNRLVSRLATALAIAVLCLAVLTRAEHFQWAPILNVFAVKGTINGYVDSREICAQSGGYLAAEATDAVHARDVEVGDATAGVQTWYAYLGGDTLAYEPSSLMQCSNDAETSNPTHPNGPMAANSACTWRWNQGRWLQYEDDPVFTRHLVNASGIAFYVTNTWSFPGVVRVANSMSYFFYNQSLPDGTNGARRPGSFFGRYLALVKNGGQGTETGSWSDVSDIYGYVYNTPGYVFYPGNFNSVFDLSKSSFSSFIAVCHVPTPGRSGNEMLDTTSGLQANWWAIFLSLLFVLCFVAFIIVVCCQEREDMDEPPEDAPEWAQKQANDRQENRSFVSQRSFRTYDEDSGAEGDVGPQDDQRSGSLKRGNSSGKGDGGMQRTSSRGNPAAKEEEYIEEDL